MSQVDFESFESGLKFFCSREVPAIDDRGGLAPEEKGRAAGDQIEVDVDVIYSIFCSVVDYVSC